MRLFALFLLLALSTQVSAQDSVLTESSIQTQSIFIEAIRNKLIDRHDLSVPQFREIIKKEPKNHVVWYELGFGLYKSKQLDEALDAAKKANELHANEKQYLSLLATIYHQKQDFLLEAGIYKKIQSLDPYSESTYVLWTDALKAEGKWEEAIKTLDLMEQKKGVNEISSLQKASLYSQLGKAKEEENELIKLNNVFPGDTKYLHALASFYTKSQKQEKAEDVYKKILAINPSDERASLAMANKFKQSGQDDQYLQSISGLIENPSISLDAKILELIPFINKALNSNDSSLLKILEKHAVSLSKSAPDNPKSLALLGDVFAAQRKDYDAFISYEKAIKAGHCPKSVWSNFLDLSSRFLPDAEHIENVEKAFDLFPNEPTYALQYSKALIWSGRAGEAKSIVMQAGLMIGDQKNYKPSLQALKYILAEEDKDQTMIVDLSKDPSLLSSVNAQKLVIDYFLNKKEQPGKAGLWIDIANKLEPKDEVLKKLKIEAESKSKTQKEIKIEGDVSNPLGQAKKLMEEGDYGSAINKFMEAYESSAFNNASKAEMMLSIANILYRKQGKYAEARQASLKAAELRPDWGAPYILIGDIYLGTARNCRDEWGSRLAVLAAIDKYQMAKSVDASSTEDVKDRVDRISSAMPDKSEGFIRGVNEGSALKVPCWIDETVKIRYKD